ncbi:hypothetical protein BT96DRAFT_972396 [Gymnopus androsaceus JB14]|uniref:TERF2-interacting telomeric protein 1 Myb domain-containing protein n=1 Tax=Gymnopus androsaceus JB14 TaxID=1447944 RepID=A0A6A4I7B1_9AGAR|nr:hypothetical protein BT96DRAFT_972396 [Gymnopus androsaceus JB14]
MVGGRNQFSPEDDALLVEYLSHYNEGRKGNAIYQQLTENRGQWPWSARHPWQSWRHRYRRESDDFDRRIRIYQRKQDTEATDQARVVPDENPDIGNGDSTRLGKRKAKPAAENRGKEKLPRIESSPDERNPQNPQDKRNRKGKMDQETFPKSQSDPFVSTGIGIVPVGELRRGQVNPDDKGEGSSRTGALMRQQQREQQVERVQADNNDDPFPSFSPPAIAVLLGTEDESDEDRNTSPEPPANDRCELNLLLDNSDPNTLVAKKVSVPPFPPDSSPVDDHDLPSEFVQPIPRSTSNHEPSQSPPFWLSASDQSRLIDSMVESLAEQYQLSTDYVLQVWKKAGDLGEVAAILKQSIDTEHDLLCKSPTQPVETNKIPLGVEGSDASQADPIITETERGDTNCSLSTGFRNAGNDSNVPMIVDSAGPEPSEDSRATVPRSGNDGAKVDGLNPSTSIIPII